MRDCEARARSLSEEVRWLRFAVDGAKARNAALKAKLAKRIAEKNTLSKPIAGVSVAYRAQEIPAAEGDDQVPSPWRSAVCAELCGRRSDSSSRFPKLRATRTAVSKSLSDQVAALRTALAEIATPEGHHQVAARGQRPAAQGREDVAEPGRDAGGRACEASCHRGGALKDALRAQEREAGGRRAPGARAASSVAPPGMAAPSGPGSRNAPKSTIRPLMRAFAHGADSPMRRTAPRNPPSSRSRSKPTSA